MGVVEELAEGGTPSSSRAGSRFGHYRLKRLLGRGGFGEVYEAEDTLMDRVVALKLLAAPYSQDQVFRQRLHREARAAGKLHEPHVVPIHQCGEIDGQLYIDMRLIEGTDLHNLLVRDGPLSPARAVAILRQIAAALDAAHNAQMVHRDVKPANILLTGDDFACLVDFGLANAATDAKLTSSGATIGTFAYMAPERLSNAEVSHRADIYALACVLYECLTGSAPYAIGDIPALITAHLTAPIPRPSQHGPQIPVAFDDVIARGMAKAANDRYASAGELARAAHRALTTPDQDLADTILAKTQAAATGDRAQAPDLGKPRGSQTSNQAAGQPTGAAKPPASSSTKARLPAKPPASSPTKYPPSAKRPAVPLGPGKTLALAALTLIAVVLILAVIGIIEGDGSSQQSAPSSAPSQLAAPPFPPSQTVHNSSPSQVELPFTGMNTPAGVAVDTAGNVYVADFRNNRVLKLPAGSTTPVELPFTGLNIPSGVAVDSAGNVYVADSSNKRVLKLPAESYIPVELPFTGLTDPSGVAVDSAGNVYVAEFASPQSPAGRVLKLPAGSATPVELPFTGLTKLGLVAVDTASNVYVTAFTSPQSPAGRVLKLPAESTTPVELPFTGLANPVGVAVDSAGNVYVADSSNNRVLKLPAQ